MPKYALNKVILVFVLLWKRGWKDCSSKSKTSFSSCFWFLGLHMGVMQRKFYSESRCVKVWTYDSSGLDREFNNMNTTRSRLLDS